MNAKFELNGKTYTTDNETLVVLRSIVPDAKATGDASAVAAVMASGMAAGRIVEGRFDPMLSAWLESID